MARELLRAQCLGVQVAGKELLIVTCSSCWAGARVCLVGLFPWHLPQKGCYHSWICVAHGHDAHSTPACPPPKPDSWPVPSVNLTFWKCRQRTPGVSP